MKTERIYKKIVISDKGADFIGEGNNWVYENEVVSFDDLMECGSMNAAKEKGLVRSEGKEYVMNDGDIVLFRFNV